VHIFNIKGNKKPILIPYYITYFYVVNVDKGKQNSN